MENINIFAIFLLILNINCLSNNIDETINFDSNVTNDNNMTRAIADELQSNIAFDLADLTHTIENGFNSHIELEAFRVMDNDKILSLNDSSKYNQLRWVSIGFPKLVETESIIDKQKRLFHTTQEGFYTFVETLTDSHRQLLANAAKYKYSINTINSNQIFYLPLSKFECSIKLFDSSSNSKIILNGKVVQFKETPLRLEFWAPVSTRERIIFLDRLNNPYRRADLSLECEIGSQGKELKVNTFTMSTSLINQLQLVDNIFGPANSSYVTREQMSTLSAEIYSKMNIVEEYGMPEFQFKETFIDDFIKQTSETLLKQTSLSEALDSISKFSISFVDDLKPDVIKSESSKIFKIEKTNNKSHIIINQEGLNHLIKTGKVENGGSGGMSFLNLFSINGSGNKVTSSQSDWLQTNKSLNDQLNEINKETQEDVQWSFEGEKIVPKSINVAKMIKSSFSKQLTFSRIRQQYYEAAFVRKFALYTAKAEVQKSETELINDKINNLNTNLINHSNEMNNNLIKHTNEMKLYIDNKDLILDKKIDQINDKNINQINNIDNSLNTKITQINHQILAINTQLKFKCISIGGSEYFSNPFPSGNAERVIKRTIFFGRTFNSIPQISISLHRLDNDKGFNLRYWQTVSSVTLNSFQLSIITWADTRLYSIEIGWTAYGCYYT